MFSEACSAKRCNVSPSLFGCLFECFGSAQPQEGIYGTHVFGVNNSEICRIWGVWQNAMQTFMKHRLSDSIAQPCETSTKDESHLENVMM